MNAHALIREKVEQARGILKEFGVDCWITFVRETQINGDPTLTFLAGGDLTWHSALILTDRGDATAIVGLYDKKMVEDTGAYKNVIGFVEGIRKPFLDVMSQLRPSRIAVNYSTDSEICDGITHGMFLTLMELLGELEMQNRVISAEGIISALRQRKTQGELAFMKNAIQITEVIFDRVAEYIRPGMTEQQVADFMRHEVEGRGIPFAWDPQMCPAVFTGPDTAGAHYTPTGRIVQQGHILNMDFGVKYNGYCSDLQRTFYVLRPGETSAPPDVKKGFDTIVESIELSRKAIRPGVDGKSVDAVARKTLVDAGYEEFPHALGHQVGRFSHDGTALLGPAWEKYRQKPFLPLEKNMVFTLEPRLTVPDRGIATIEEMVVVTDEGAEYLSTPQKKLYLIPAE
jgi:Xaa-Pro aminopeptidase